jgi:hypothetical protein
MLSTYNPTAGVLIREPIQRHIQLQIMEIKFKYMGQGNLYMIFHQQQQEMIH